MNNIVLVGFMGVGKSTVGKALAKRLSYEFYDSDDKIQQIAGMDITEIFKTHGEKYFRRLEYEVITAKIGQRNVVISTGGGAVMNEQLYNLLLSKAIVIHLEASLEILYHRLSNSSNRPMLDHHDLKKRIDELYELRHPIYMKAHHNVKIDGKDLNSIVEEILSIVK